MTKRICKTCNIEQPITNFYLNKNKKDPKGYYLRQCKDCTNAKEKCKRQDKENLAYLIHKSQKYSAKQRNHPEPTYTKEELKIWLNEQELFHKLYEHWKNNNFHKALKPSIDRIDDYKSYTFDNIQLMTWQENNEKFVSDQRNGINTKKLKPVIQKTIDGFFVAEYISMAHAELATGISARSISQLCKQEDTRTYVKGFLWEFKEK